MVSVEAFGEFVFDEFVFEDAAGLVCDGEAAGGVFWAITVGAAADGGSAALAVKGVAVDLLCSLLSKVNPFALSGVNDWPLSATVGRVPSATFWLVREAIFDAWSFG